MRQPPATTEEDIVLCSSLLDELRSDTEVSGEEAAGRLAATADFLVGLDPATGSAVRVECLLAVAHWYYLAARPVAGLQPADRAVGLARALDDPSLLRKALTILGAMNKETGNLPEATACFSEALAIAQRLGDVGAEAPVWNNLGVALQNAAQYADAIQCFERAAVLAENSPAFRAVRQLALSNIAGCALHLHDVRTGIKAVRRAIELNPDPQSATDCLSRVISESNYARLLLEVGETGHAAEHCEKARLYAAKVPTARAEYVASLTSGLIDVHSGRIDVGLTRLKRTLEQARLNVRSEVRDALSACITGYEVAGQPDVALVYLHELLALNKEAKQAQVLMHHREHIARLERAEQGAFDIETVLRHQQVRLDAACPALPLVGAKALALEQQAIVAELVEDPSGRHAYRVGKLARLLGQACGFDPVVCEHLELAGRLHDIGKLVIPDALLRKPAPLSPAESQIVQKHATEGAELLAQAHLQELQIAEEVARYSHERWDGTGYPCALSGSAIPVHARIVALAETFDVLTHPRPHRPKALPPAQALTEIQMHSGRQFDPALTKTFVALVRRLLDEHPDLPAWLAQDAATSPFLQARDAIGLALRSTALTPHNHAPDAPSSPTETETSAAAPLLKLNSVTNADDGASKPPDDHDDFTSPAVSLAYCPPSLGPAKLWSHPRIADTYAIVSAMPPGARHPIDMWVAAGNGGTAISTTDLAALITCTHNHAQLTLAASCYVEQLRRACGLSHQTDHVTLAACELRSVLLSSDPLESRPRRMCLRHPDIHRHAVVVEITPTGARRLYLTPLDGSLPDMLLPDGTEEMTFFAGLAECCSEGLAPRSETTDPARSARLRQIAHKASRRLDPSGLRPFRMGRLCFLLGQELGADPRFCKRLETAGQVADVGYCIPPGARDGCANGAIADPADGHSRRHPVIGGEILELARVEDHGFVHDAVLFHHERPDGSGYPSQLRGYQIPFPAQAVALADCFDTLMYAPNHDARLQPHAAIAQIEAGIGVRFIREIAEPFLQVLRRLVAQPDAFDREISELQHQVH